MATTNRPFAAAAPLAAALLAAALVAVTVTPLAGQQQRLIVSRQPVSPDAAQEARLPAALRDLGWEQKPGAQIPLEATFRDQDGSTVRLADLLGERAAILVPVYYQCPMLCSLVLDGLVRGLRPLKFLPGQEFEVIAVSIDPREQPALARATLDTMLTRYGRRADSGWQFLVGDEPDIRALTESIGFRYRFDAQTGLYGHAGGVVLLTSDGRVARYLYGVEFTPRDLRLGLLEAAAGRIGSVVDQVLLFCYRYDPAIGKYSAAITNLVRLGGVATAVLLGAFVLISFRRERRATTGKRQSAATL